MNSAQEKSYRVYDRNGLWLTSHDSKEEATIMVNNATESGWGGYYMKKV